MPSPQPLNLDDWDVLVGRIKGRWDVAKLRIQPFSEVKGRFGAGAKLCAVQDGKRHLLEVRTSNPKNGLWVCDCGLTSSDVADALVGAEVFVHRSMRPQLPEGEFYPDEIIGMRIAGEDGEDLGEVEEVLDSPAHDIYVTSKAMVPAVPEFILRIDGKSRVVTVRNAAQFLE